MSDEHVSQEPARDAGHAIPQKPKYEAPAIVDLSSPAKGASGLCSHGSDDLDECSHGLGAASNCSGGTFVY